MAGIILLAESLFYFFFDIFKSVPYTREQSKAIFCAKRAKCDVLEKRKKIAAFFHPFYFKNSFCNSLVHRELRAVIARWFETHTRYICSNEIFVFVVCKFFTRCRVTLSLNGTSARFACNIWCERWAGERMRAWKHGIKPFLSHLYFFTFHLH